MSEVSKKAASNGHEKMVISKEHQAKVCPIVFTLLESEILITVVACENTSVQ